ncbi:telomere repeats-binding bouquet formation protein 1 [Amia ocellicauda]|uniref:telomere repeats-binding bouquet formation protein 1 n=1 Tax=Amia ocellicauda TaxID=2972642 RepID=UPI0034639B7B
MEVSNQDGGRRLCELKTDINLLLECLKYQMDCPSSQKQALVTIYSICQQNGDIVDYFRDIGGLLFLFKLSKSVANVEVKEAALFTLGGLAESNVFCKQVLCSTDLFTELSQSLSPDSPLNLKRVAVYMVSVLVINNKSGQTLVKTTGCIDILLNLFRTSFPISHDNMRQANITQSYQLWTSVSNALCGCVNNPQNEENQRICASAFPVSNEWLQKCVRKEIIQPICTFIGMTVSDNAYAQGCFAAAGGLDTLTQNLVKLASNCSTSPSACDLVVVMTKTLCACIADNAHLSSTLPQYHLVPKLVSLVSSQIFNSEDLLCIVLALGLCTEACEEHQIQLLQSGGLPQMIQLLTAPQDEEVKQAATFVLQTCKQITENLAPDLSEQPCQVPGKSHRNLQSYQKSASAMWERLDILEKMHAEAMQVNVDEFENNGENSCDEFLGSMVTAQCASEPVDQQENASHRIPLDTLPALCSSSQTAKTARALDREHRPQSESQIDFKCPAPVKKSNKTQKQTRISVEDHFSICSEVLDHEIDNILKTPALVNQHKTFRCSEIRLTPVGKERHLWKYPKGLCDKADREWITLTPQKKSCNTEDKGKRTQQREDTTVDLQETKDGDLYTFYDSGDSQSNASYKTQVARRRNRKNFSAEEVGYLLDGVKNLGYHWNSILWSYPFHKGRTNVDLAKKYSQLKAS